jgi:hypothetical protein
LGLKPVCAVFIGLCRWSPFDDVVGLVPTTEEFA